MVATPRRKRRREPRSDSAMATGQKKIPTQVVLLNALTALKGGDLAVRLPLDWIGMAGKVADAFNEIVASNERTTQELVQLRQAGRRDKSSAQCADRAQVRRFLRPASVGLGRHRW